MTLDGFRLRMRSYRQSADDESKSLKDPHIALERLRALYVKFDAAERDMADRVLGEWALSDEEGVRFDALALIDDLKIGIAMPALKEIALRLMSSTAPSAPYELKKVYRIMERLVD
jgi:hypothetical protein